MSRVLFDNVTKRFGDTVAVQSLSLDISDGEFLVLLGPSGCGKTTALRMVAGLETISDGTLKIGDRVVNHVEPKDRDISMVFQSYALYPHMTVAKNIESPLLSRKVLPDNASPNSKPRRLQTKERTSRVQEAAKILGLEQYLERKPGALSGGQRQRVALARSIVSRPKVFLMDEPLSNLDAKLRAQTRAEIVGLHKRLATTFLYVTHDQIEAMTMADRIAIMAQGKLQQVGTPREVYDNPANLFVARFIGSPPMNTIAVTFSPVEGAPGLAIGGSVVPVQANLPASLSFGTALVAGIRPENLHLGYGPMTGIVQSIEWLGHELLVSCDIGGQLVTVRETTTTNPPAKGSSVKISVDPQHVYLFDPASGARLS